MNRGKRFVVQGYEGRAILGDVRKPASQKAVPLIIFAHGFKGFKDWGHFNLMADYFAAQGFAFLKFNFSHNGGTLQQPIDFPDLEAFSENTFWKELQDIKALLDALEGKNRVQEGAADFMDFSAGVDHQQIYLIGHSRGGGIAILSAARDARISKVVNWAGVGDFKRYIPSGEQLSRWQERGVVYVENKRTLQQMPMKFTFVESLIQHSKDLDILQAVKQLQQPLMLIHGDADQVVELSDAKELKRINSAIVLQVIKDGDHVFGAKHPWVEVFLPGDTKHVIDLSIQFLKGD